MFKKGLEKTKGFTYLGVSVNCGDMLSSLPFFVLWIHNLAFEGYFISKRKEWEASIACKITSMCFSTSTVLCPLAMVLFTFARYQVVKSPLHTVFKDNTCVVLRVTAVWVISVSTGFILTFLFWIVDSLVLSTESLKILCSPFVDLSKGNLMSHVLVWFLFLYHSVSVTCIMTFYTKLVLCLHSSKKNLSDVRSKQSQKGMITQIVILTVPTFSWVCSSLVFLFAMYSNTNVINLVVWNIVAVAPLTSVTNPIVLTFITARKFVSSGRVTRGNRNLPSRFPYRKRQA